MGSNKKGFENEQNIINYINQKKYYANMCDNMKSFLSFLYNDTDISNSEFTAFRPTGYRDNIKTDIIITTNNIKRHVSVKSGKNNSVHQEHVGEFTKFLSQKGISQTTIKYLLEYHYADGTTDGSGEHRYEVSHFKKLYPAKIKQINLDMNKPELLKILFDRFLFIGCSDNVPEVDAIYYGTEMEGIWASKNEIVEYLLQNNEVGTSIAFSHLNYQAWKRNLNFNPKAEKDRHDIQIKWSSLQSDLIKIKQMRAENEH